MMLMVSATDAGPWRIRNTTTTGVLHYFPYAELIKALVAGATTAISKYLNDRPYPHPGVAPYLHAERRRDVRSTDRLEGIQLHGSHATAVKPSLQVRNSCYYDRLKILFAMSVM